MDAKGKARARSRFSHRLAQLFSRFVCFDVVAVCVGANWGLWTITDSNSIVWKLDACCCWRGVDAQRRSLRTTWSHIGRKTKRCGTHNCVVAVEEVTSYSMQQKFVDTGTAVEDAGITVGEAGDLGLATMLVRTLRPMPGKQKARMEKTHTTVIDRVRPVAAANNIATCQRVVWVALTGPAARWRRVNALDVDTTLQLQPCNHNHTLQNPQPATHISCAKYLLYIDWAKPY
ncbi:hypothetical protein EDC01DRAFT_263393 [Geopyxis carbonaria]|nr:hypothetical protein EDC01DRAFT_263393 [Geopyxis carbonaria]